MNANFGVLMQNARPDSDREWKNREKQSKREREILKSRKRKREIYRDDERKRWSWSGEGYIRFVKGKGEKWNEREREALKKPKHEIQPPFI